MAIRQSVPWWLRIGAKLLLARLPLPYAFWKRLRLFEHGDMNNPERALETVVAHAQTAGLVGSSSGLWQFMAQPEGGLSVLELGPGDSLFSAMILRALGACRSWLVDAGAFATHDSAAYAEMSAFLRKLGYAAPSITLVDGLQETLQACKSEYLTEGISSLGRLPDGSVDYCFSNAVLEHISRSDFHKLVVELRRVMKPSGICVHRVDLKDHLGGGLNNLRFSDATWEGDIFKNSGFYTNRIRFKEMLALFEEELFAVTTPRIVRWDKLPIARAALALPFRGLPDEDLLISGFDVVLRPKCSSATPQGLRNCECSSNRATSS